MNQASPPLHSLVWKQKEIMKYFLGLLLLCLGVLRPATAISNLFEGIELPEFRKGGGLELKRNGQGIRSVWGFKIYVAAMYTLNQIREAKDIMDCHGDCPLQLDFTFLRSVSGKQSKTAWQKQLEYSVSYHYDGYEKDRDDFIEKMSGPIANGGTLSVRMIGDDTEVVAQGIERGVVRGKGFQKAFLSMWFGDRPVANDLKVGLLEGAAHLNPILAAV